LDQAQPPARLPPPQAPPNHRQAAPFLATAELAKGDMGWIK
jgi:hypothetical protein